MAKLNFKDLKKKYFTTKTLVISIAAFAVLSILLLSVQSMTPRKGNILYGMCSKFLELQIKFPETIEEKEIELYRKGVRISYTHLDGFGEYRLETIECAFIQDPDNGVQIEDVFFNYVKPATYNERIVGKGRLYKVKKEEIEMFNRSKSPAAILNEIDLSIPEGAVIRAY